jgi:phosphoserine phosphatase RsbU/P
MTGLSAALIMLLLAAIALSGVLLYQWRLSQRQLEARTAELRTLSDAARAIASATLDEDELYRLVYRQAVQIADVADFQIGLFEDERCVLKLHYRHGVEQVGAVGDLCVDNDMVSWVRAHGRPLIVRDLRAQMVNHAGDGVLRSAVFVPMMARDVMIGMLVVQSERANAYADSQARMLGILAHQTAAAIQNARALRQERMRAQQMELVSAIARSTALVFTLADLLPRLVEAIRAAFGYLFVGVFLKDELGYVVCRAASRQVMLGKRVRPGDGLIGACVAEDCMIAVCQSHPNRYSEVVLPLRIGERVIGALHLQASDPKAFGPSEAHYLELLAQQVSVAVEDARLYEQSLERQRLAQELALARDIQASFLPRSVPNVAGWSVAGRWRAAKQVGGDFYDFIPLPDGRWGVVIADVADKGVPAALFMIFSRTLIRAAMSSSPGPADVLARANTLIQTDAMADLFVTVLCAVWDPRSGQIWMASAGHLAPLLCRADRSVSTVRLAGPALGVLERIVPEQICLALQSGDVLLFYTDGLTDAMNASGEAFGLARLKAALSEAHGLDAGQIAASVLSAVDAFTGDEPPFDDQALIVIKREA